MTNEQINRMAAEALGICFEHSWVNEASSGLVLCEICKRSKHLESSFPDFCNDLNAAQRLVKHTFNTDTAENLKSNRFADVIFDALSIDAVTLNNNPNLSNRDLVTLYRDATAKTITLACLVALGKITLEEAKENL